MVRGPEANLGYIGSEAYIVLEIFFKKKNTQFWLSVLKQVFIRMRKEITTKLLKKKDQPNR